MFRNSHAGTIVSSSCGSQVTTDYIGHVSFGLCQAMQAAKAAAVMTLSLHKDKGSDKGSRIRVWACSRIFWRCSLPAKMKPVVERLVEGAVEVRKHGGKSGTMSRKSRTKVRKQGRQESGNSVGRSQHH